MYPYPQQIGRSQSFLIIQVPHLSSCWWHHKLFVAALIYDLDIINVETLDTLVLWLRVWRISCGWCGESNQLELNVQPTFKDVLELWATVWCHTEFYFNKAHKWTVNVNRSSLKVSSHQKRSKLGWGRLDWWWISCDGSLSWSHFSFISFNRTGKGVFSAMKLGKIRSSKDDHKRAGKTMFIYTSQKWNSDEELGSYIFVF